MFLGTDAFVTDGRREAIDIVGDIAREWDLDLHIETATDPFFATVYAAKTFFQQSLDVKYEIRLGVEPDASGKARSIAGGSINMHGPFFGNRFDIKLDEGVPQFPDVLASVSSGGCWHCSVSTVSSRCASAGGAARSRVF